MNYIIDLYKRKYPFERRRQIIIIWRLFCSKSPTSDIVLAQDVICRDFEPVGEMAVYRAVRRDYLVLFMKGGISYEDD